MLKKILRSKRGEGYLDVCILVLCAMLVIALAVRIFPVFVAKQQLDTFATELIREAEIAGRVGSETDRREQALREQTGLTPIFHGAVPGVFSSTKRWPLQSPMKPTLACSAALGASHYTSGGCYREIGGVLEMTRLREILRDRKGNGFPLAIAITLALVIIFCGISEYIRLLIIAQGVRDAVQTAVISTVNDNYDDVYHGVREGYSGGYQPMAGDFEESLDYGDIYGRLEEVLGLSYQGGTRVKFTEDGKTEFRVWGLDVDIENAPLAGGDRAGNRFVANCEIELEVPVSFGGRLLPAMRITVATSAGYTPRF